MRIGSITERSCLIHLSDLILLTDANYLLNKYKIKLKEEWILCYHWALPSKRLTKNNEKTMGTRCF